MILALWLMRSRAALRELDESAKGRLDAFEGNAHLRPIGAEVAR
jgi:hypothetical protein